MPKLTTFLVLALSLTNCRTISNENASEVMATQSPDAYHGATPVSCDQATQSFKAKGIQPFMRCKTTSAEIAWIIEFANVDSADNKGYSVREQVCFHTVPEDQLSYMRSIGYWLRGEEYDERAHLAEYAVKVTNTQGKFEVTDGGLYFPAGVAKNGEDFFFEGVFYKVRLDAIQKGSRKGHVIYGPSGKWTVPVACDVY